MRHYLSNMEIRTKEITIEAIRRSGRTDIHIDDEPMPNQFKEYMTGHYYSVYVDNFTDCSDFWNIYDTLCKTEEWGTYLKLTRID